MLELDAPTERIAVVATANAERPLLPVWFLPGFGAMILVAIMAVVVVLTAAGRSAGIYQGSSLSAAPATSTQNSSLSPDSADFSSPRVQKYLTAIDQGVTVTGSAPLDAQDRATSLGAGERACADGESVDQLVPDVITAFGPTLAAPFRAQGPSEYSAAVAGAATAVRTAETTLCPPS